MPDETIQEPRADQREGRPGAPQTPLAARRTLSRRKKLIFSAIILAAVVPVTEIAVRLGYYLTSGFNPYYFRYGFTSTSDGELVSHGDYFKFPPNQPRHMKEGTETIEMKINSDGFRSLQDFARPKPPGTFRIAVLGASSTFGFHDRDDETYPYQLEQMLQSAFPKRRIEVLNLGIPNLRTDAILALAEHELPSLKPDLVTFYEGAADANRLKSPQKAHVVYRLKDWLYFHSIAWRVIHPGFKRLYFTLVGATNRDILQLPNLTTPVFLERAKVEPLRTRMRGEFRANVEGMVNLAEKLGAPMVLITQAYTLHYYLGCGLEDRWLTYGQELDFINDIYAQKGGLLAPQLTLLAHADMMDELRELAQQRRLLLVNGIAALDRDRKQMRSYVHLSATGNRLLAEAIAEGITRAGLIPATLANP